MKKKVGGRELARFLRLREGSGALGAKFSLSPFMLLMHGMLVVGAAVCDRIGACIN
ncbi:hypothetical protein COLO4_37802 [Corchorus olitorius]|uniref:Uncharacterized protein n=1 Tax=Corchorus olitorius TaxID=93759 RepID=A0A1R3FZB6_9ROSI|nr:hypothetical protein COLO4_37802 [Corchorus olitorius]